MRWLLQDGPLWAGGVKGRVLGAAANAQTPIAGAVPTISPATGTTGSAFTITPGSYTNSTGINGTLTFNGTTVATRNVGTAFNYTPPSPQTGPLVWTEVATNNGTNAPARAASASVVGALQPFYDTGTIGIHLNTDGASPAAGPASSLANQGAAGATFNATVVGTPLPISGRFLEATTTTGYPQTAAPADLIGVRLMWVARPASATGSYRYFGRNDTINTNIRINSGTQFNLISNRTGTNVSVSFPNITASALARIFEIEMTATEATLWVNGAFVGTVTHPWTAFNIDRLTQGNSPTLQLFEGGLGDVLGVITGQANTAAAISAARSYLNSRFSLGLTLP